jgi:DsbC/DsbD-like thiol-disulfide interchange protein
MTIPAIFASCTVGLAWVAQKPAPPAPALPTYISQVSTTVAARDRKSPPSSWFANVHVKVADGWHIYADKPGDEFAIPTKLEWTLPKGFTSVSTVFPEPVSGPGGAKVLTGDVMLSTTLIAGSTVKPGKVRIQGFLSSQGCNDSSCLPPTRIPVSVEIVVGKR